MQTGAFAILPPGTGRIACDPLREELQQNHVHWTHITDAIKFILFSSHRIEVQQKERQQFTPWMAGLAPQPRRDPPNEEPPKLDEGRNKRPPN